MVFKHKRKNAVVFLFLIFIAITKDRTPIGVDLGAFVAAGAALEVLAAAVEAAAVATTAVATTEAVAEYTPQTGKRRLRGRKGITGNGGRVARDSQGHRSWPVVLAVHRPLAAGAIGPRGQEPSGV